jgi:putative endonuclease
VWDTRACSGDLDSPSVYMMANRRDGTLYAGVASDLPRRAYQHRKGLIKGFTKRYGLKLLVYYESSQQLGVEKVVKVD